MHLSDLVPRSTSIPLAARTAIGRRAAAVLAALALTAGLIAATNDPEVSVEFALSFAVAATTLALAALVVAGNWTRRLSERAQERVLWALTGVPSIGLLVVHAADAPDDPDALLLLAPALVVGVLTLPPRTFALTGGAILTAATVLAVTRGSFRDLAFALAMLVAITLLATQAAAILSVTLRRQLEREEESLALSRALRAVVDGARTATTSEATDVLEAVVAATRGLDSDTAGIYLLHADDSLRWASTWNVPDTMVDEVVPRTRGLAGRALAENRTVVTNDYVHDASGLTGYQELGLRAAVASPIRVDGEAVGVLAAGRYRPGGYDDAAVAALDLLANHAGHALALSRAIDEDRQLLHRLQSLHALQEDFVATVSHELRTPITVISGLAETLDRHSAVLTREQHGELLSRLRANTTTLTTIVTSLLEAARLDRGLVEVEASAVDLWELVEGCAARLAPVLTDHKLELDLEDAVVVADGALLERVFDNLLTNAERHTPPGTRVEVSTRIDGDECLVTIADDGPGIPAADLARITERFTRGGDLHTRSTRGLGLGLALADQVLRLHGSRLEVTSPPGSGARFRFRLRVAT